MRINLQHIANGLSPDFPAPMGDGAVTVTVNGAPASVNTFDGYFATLASIPPEGAVVVVSRANNTAAASGVAPGYDTQDDMLKVKSVQNKFRDSFGGSSVDTTQWDVAVGAGASVSVSGGSLTLGSGTVANSETSLTTRQSFTIPFRVTFDLAMSQRIANHEFYVEAISVDPATGVPDGKHCAAFRFDGTTATSAKYEVQNSGQPRLTSAASTVPTTAGGVSLYEIEPFADECWFHGGAVDSVTGRVNSYRRHQSIPDPNAQYKLRIRWKNLATAPVSTTNAVLRFVAVQDYAELTAEITAGRGNVSEGQALGVRTVSPVTIAGTVATVLQNPTTTSLTATSSTNATLVKNTAGNLMGIVASNVGAAGAFLKVYNKATAPVPGTDVPVLTVPLPSGQVVSINTGALGLRLSSGIGMAVTLNAADTDTTALGASPGVKVNIGYV